MSAPEETTEADEPQEIKASDLVKLMGVVHAAAGLYNALEQIKWVDLPLEFDELGEALRALGLREVT